MTGQLQLNGTCDVVYRTNDHCCQTKTPVVELNKKLYHTFRSHKVTYEKHLNKTNHTVHGIANMS